MGFDMTTQTIKVEGLPEGWKAKEFRLGEVNEPYYDPATKSICRLLLGSTVGVLIVEKIQRSRIVLESTTESRKAVFGDWIYSNGFIDQWRSEKESQSIYEIWREVKETDVPLTKDEPKLSLNKKDMLELIEHIKLGGQLNPKIAEFIKDK